MKQDVVTLAAAEHEAEHHPHGHDHRAEDQVHPERERPGGVTAPADNHKRGGGDE